MSNQPVSSPNPADLAVSFARGPLVGTFLGLILYGVTCMQAFFYFRTYCDQDGWRLKLTVALLVVLDTIHAALTMSVMDDYLIAKYADVDALQSATWSYASTYTLGLVIDFYVYMYFTWRIWLFTHSKWIVVFMIAVSISRTAISVIAAVLSISKPNFPTYLATYKTLLLVGNALFILGDTFSACAMAYYLSKYKSWVAQSGVPTSATGVGAGTLPPPPTTRRPPRKPRRIHVVLNRLLVFAVATGAVTSLVDVIALILTLAKPTTLAFLSTILVQTRLYANSLLASLNIRHAASALYDDTSFELAPISLRFARPSDLSTTSEDSASRDNFVPRRGRDSKDMTTMTTTTTTWDA